MRRLGLLAFAGLLLVTGDARAFCRTTIMTAPADWDAVQNGCFSKDSIPLFWRNACVGYSIQSSGSRKISYDDAANLLSQAFTRWSGATCADDGTGRSRVSIDVRDLGPAACAKVEYKPGGIANQNVIIFRDEDWPHPHTVLGLTTVTYDKTNGELFNADMEINTFDMTPLAVRDPVGPNDYDFLSVVTHEAGHFIGLGHSDIVNSTMVARYKTGQTGFRNLSPDDITAVCTVYRPNGDRAVLDSKVTAAPQCDPTPRGGYSSECAEPEKCCVIAAGAARGGGFAALAGAATVIVAVLRRRRRLR